METRSSHKCRTGIGIKIAIQISNQRTSLSIGIFFASTPKKMLSCCRRQCMKTWKAGQGPHSEHKPSEKRHRWQCKCYSILSKTRANKFAGSRCRPLNIDERLTAVSTTGISRALQLNEQSLPSWGIASHACTSNLQKLKVGNETVKY